jgi:hypothetical protein
MLLAATPVGSAVQLDTHTYMNRVGHRGLLMLAIGPHVQHDPTFLLHGLDILS